jgi:large subunit ribosomal protein LP0
MPRERDYSDKKKAYFKKMNDLLDEYNKIIIVGIDNVSSQQFHDVRKELRGKATMLLGKNTQMKKVLQLRNQRDERSAADVERDKNLQQKFVSEAGISGNIGLIFTNEELSVIKTAIEKYRVQAPARVGSISPVDVTIPEGNTGLPPDETKFFQALNVQTKIAKGTVEITVPKKVLTKGDKVGNSEATLLLKLNIKPFFYGLIITSIWDNGSVYGPEVLEMSDDMFESFAKTAVNNVAAVSLALGYPTEAAFPHMVMNAFKNLLAVSISTDYEFKEFKGDEIRKAVKEGRSLGGPAPAAATGAAPAASAAAAPAKKEAPKEESDNDMGFGLFD